jgi:hypothetical protein
MRFAVSGFPNRLTFDSAEFPCRDLVFAENDLLNNDADGVTSSRRIADADFAVTQRH